MSESKVIVYASMGCPYCHSAQSFLDDKAVSYELIRVDKVRGARAEMESRSGRTSVPQIFIGEHHVGGFDDLVAADAAGALDPLLGRG